MVTIVRIYNGEHNCTSDAGVWYEDRDDWDDVDVTNINYMWVRKEPAVCRQVTFCTTREYANCIREASANMVLDCDEILNFVALSETIEIAYRGILKELWV